jgi:CelD/BcsL family acetyltransferase involved in cellulose biosynthesis
MRSAAVVQCEVYSEPSIGAALPKVRAHLDFDSCILWSQRIEEMAAASKRPYPFGTLQFLQAYWRNDEYEAQSPEREVLLLTAWDQERLVGFLPLRRSRARLRGVRFWKLELLATHDIDRPLILCEPRDEQRCSRAFFEHLVHRSDWDLLEFIDQEADSPLASPPADLIGFPDFLVRHLDSQSYATVPIQWPDASAYFRSLKSKMRSNIGRQVRNLCKAGQVTYVRSEDPTNLRQMLQLYLELENQSWKSKAAVGIGRNPRRVALFEELLRPEQPMSLSIEFVVLDGSPVAGMVSGAFGDTLYALETAYSDGHQQLGPGALMLMMGMCRAINRPFRFYGLMHGFSYFKQRWGADLHPTQIVRISRVGTVPFFLDVASRLKAKIEQELSERMPRLGDTAAAKFNASRHEVLADSPTPAPNRNPTWHDQIRALPGQIEILDLAALETQLPFSCLAD